MVVSQQALAEIDSGRVEANFSRVFLFEGISIFNQPADEYGMLSFNNRISLSRIQIIGESSIHPMIFTGSESRPGRSRELFGMVKRSIKRVFIQSNKQGEGNIVSGGMSEVFNHDWDGPIPIGSVRHVLINSWKYISLQLALCGIRHNFNSSFSDIGTFFSGSGSVFGVNDGFTHQSQLIEKRMAWPTATIIIKPVKNTRRLLIVVSVSRYLRSSIFSSLSVCLSRVSIKTGESLEPRCKFGDLAFILLDCVCGG